MGTKNMIFVRRSTIRVILLSAFLVLYLIVGSLVFSALEAPREDEWRQKLRQARHKFLVNHTCLSDNELENFIVEIVEANNRGVSAVNNVSNEPNWSFGQSLFFAGTVLTTIGYGHVTPLSEGGKIFCIIYALVGIPLTLIMLTAVVERLMILTNKLFQFIKNKLGHIYKEFHMRLIQLLIVLLFLVIFIFIIPAAVFSTIETRWNFLDAFYYCFISMTTIGLGDYIPGDDPHQKQRAVYKIFTTVYLFIGLCLMMLLLASINEVPELNLGLRFYMSSDEVEEERSLLPKSQQAGPKYMKQVDEQPEAKQDSTKADTDEVKAAPSTVPAEASQ